MKLNQLMSEAIKQRLDAKCWKGKHKEGTKIKGGIRVNNCVPNESTEQQSSENENPYGYEVGQTVRLDNGKQGRVIDIFDDSIEVLLPGGRTITVDFRDAEVLDSESRKPEFIDRMMNKYTDDLPRTSSGVPKTDDNLRAYYAAGKAKKDREQGLAEGEKKTMSRAAKGHEKYGKKGMQALAKAGRDGASEEKLDKIRDKHDKYDESIDDLARVLELSGLNLTADEQFDIIEEMVESLALEHGVDAETIWEDFESVDDTELLESAAWRRSAGKSKKGGLNAKGVASYRRENPGSKLQMAVTTKPSKLKPGSKAAKRRKSFCARMGGSKGPMKKPNGEPTRKALALRKWNC